MLAIKLGIVKLVCAEPSYDSLTRYRMNKFGKRFKDIAMTLKTSSATIRENVIRAELIAPKSEILRIRINNYFKQLEKKR